MPLGRYMNRIKFAGIPRRCSRRPAKEAETTREEDEMVRICKFLQDGQGSVTIDSMELAAGSLTLGIMAIYVVLSGSSPIPSGNASDRAAWASTEGTIGPVAQLADSDALPLTESVVLPVGSTVIHGDRTLTVFKTPDGGWVDAWSEDGEPIPEGTILTSRETFVLPDGSTLVAPKFVASISEVYGSNVKYAFK